MSRAKELLSLLEDSTDKLKAELDKIKQELHDYNMGPKTGKTAKRQERIAKVDALKKRKKEIEAKL